MHLHVTRPHGMRSVVTVNAVTMPCLNYTSHYVCVCVGVCIALYCIALCCIVLCRIVLYCIVLCCIVLYVCLYCSSGKHLMLSMGPVCAHCTFGCLNVSLV